MPRVGRRSFRAGPRAAAARWASTATTLHRRPQAARPHPGPRRYHGRARKYAYNNLLRAVFDGVRWFYLEEYNGDGSHQFHRTKEIKEEVGFAKRWDGQLYFFDPEDKAFGYPEVTPCIGTLDQTAATAFIYRVMPILGPAKVRPPRVAMLVTDESVFLEGKFVYPTGVLENLLSSSRSRSTSCAGPFSIAWTAGTTTC